jgi:hypothetical protein
MFDRMFNFQVSELGDRMKTQREIEKRVLTLAATRVAIAKDRR